MRITPIEIRQKDFEKHFRGYDKDEVNAFLVTLSQEWERVIDENKEMRIKLESAEREVLKLREVEGSLYKTLKTAEDTGASVIEQARHSAELHMREIQLKSEALLNESKMKAKDMIEEAESQSRQILVDMEERLKMMVDQYKKMEVFRDGLMGELKRLAHDTIERIERTKTTDKGFDPEHHVNQVRKETNMRAVKETRNVVREPVPDEKPLVVPAPAVAESPSVKTQRSFFDELG